MYVDTELESEGEVLGPYKILQDNSYYYGEWYNGVREGKGIALW